MTSKEKALKQIQEIINTYKLTCSDASVLVWTDRAMTYRELIDLTNPKVVEVNKARR